MKVVNEEIKPNSKTFISVKVTMDLDGGDISIPVHVIAGAEKGPTLALFAALHGCEWLTVEAIRRLVQKTKPNDLAGTLVAVSVGNPVAFGNYLRRSTPDDSDNMDLNRVFPGSSPHGSPLCISEQLGAKLTEEVLARSDYLIDFHSGIWGPTWDYVAIGIDFPKAEVVKKCEEMGKAFGRPYIVQNKMMGVFPGPKSAAGYFSGVLGKPSIMPSIGGAGFGEALEEKWINSNITGVENVMKHLKMLKGEPNVPQKYLFVRNPLGIRPSIGGILIPKISADLAMQKVTKGELLGQVISPYSFEVLEELRSPVTGLVLGSTRMYPVRPGDWAFYIADLDDPNTRWVPAR